MKYKHASWVWALLWILLAGSLLAGLLLPAIQAARIKSERIKIMKGLHELPRHRILSAVSSYSQNGSTGQTQSNWVAVDVLIAEGLLAPSDIRDFKSAEVFVFPGIGDDDSEELLRVGTKWEWVILRADGTLKTKDK